MTGVDDNIVSMKFDNAVFESKVADTIKSLDRLKTSLDFAGSKRGLDDLSTAGKNFNMNGMNNALEGVSGKFLAMTTVGITALATLTTHALSTAANISKAFTISPVLDGFREYETQLNSVQTILANTASKGTTLDEVNAALQKLNEYSDKTIYNFGQMARNIGTFTAAGVDLDTSVSSIKGIANLAAMSGSNSEQASTAMYQLSQAISTGSVKLMDWNSVVNAGMGGEAFKSALFETGKALGTLGSVPVGQSFKEWEDAGNSFRETLQDGWITADVLTTTLSAFTGDMTKEMLLEQGFNEQQAESILKTAKIALSAATEVKTFTQLMGTVKEAVGTGWADSFKIIIGNFEEAKQLWTGVNNSIGGFISRSAEARNNLLQGWKDLGGRSMLLEAFGSAVGVVGHIIGPISQSFRDIFPRTTAQRLYDLTVGFKNLMDRLTIGYETIEKVRSIARGFFAVFSIGWTVVKEVGALIVDFIKELAPAGSGVLDFSAKIGDMLVYLQQGLVDGGQIHEFFIRLREVIKAPIEFIGQLKDTIIDFFKSFSDNSDAETGLGRVNSRFEELKATADQVSGAWDRLTERFKGVFDVLDRTWEAIKTWFAELGGKIAEAFKPGDFDAAVDVVNVGLLGGILIMLRKFFKEGLKLDFGGLVDKITGVFDQLTGTLKAMQTNLKAEALLKIAAALGILTVSLVVLSLIDSASLTKALTAITVGFGQLVGVMVLLDRAVASPTAAAKLALLSAGLVGIATSMVILSVAIKVLSTLDWNELTKGLIGVGGGLAILVVGVNLISGNSVQMIAAGLGMIAISTALVILSGAIKAFATMSWEDIGKGLAAVAGGLALITLAMNFMPAASVISGLGFIEISIGLTILAGALKLFGLLSWDEIGRGLVGIAGGLLIIAGAMNIMPITTPIIAAGVVILSAALIIMAKAVKMMGENDIETLGKGIGAFAAMLLVLSGAMIVMSAAAGGAVALVVVAGAMVILTNVIERLGAMDLGDIVKAIGALAGALVILGLTSAVIAPFIPLMLGLGIAIGVLGVGFALIGGGAILIAKAFEIMAESGVAGAKAMLEGLKMLIGMLPELLGAIAQAIIGFGEELLRAMPLLLRLITAVLDGLLDAIIQLTPKIAKALVGLIKEGLKLIREVYPDLVQTGLEMLLALLQGIKDNIGEITKTVADIVIGFIDALREKVPEIVDSVYELLVTIIEEVVRKVAESAPSLAVRIGVAIIEGLLTGLADAAGRLFDFFKELPGRLLTIVKEALGIDSPSTKFIEIGVNILTGLLNGLIAGVGAVMTFFIELPVKIIEWIGDVAGKLKDKGIELLGGLKDGFIEKMEDIAIWIKELPGKIKDKIGDTLTTLKDKGFELLGGLFNGITDRWVEIVAWAGGLPGKFLDWIPNPLEILVDIGKDIMDGLLDGLGKGWEKVTGFLSNLDPRHHFNDINPKKGHAIKNLVPVGKDVMAGLHNGMKSGWDVVTNWLEKMNPSEYINISMTNSISDSLSKLINQLEGIDNFNPVITPVLDLTKVQAESSKLENFMRLSPITPEVSIDRARTISTTTDLDRAGEVTPDTSGPTEITFEQNIFSPTALSVNDIYRNTKSQIALAKEELGI